YWQARLTSGLARYLAKLDPASAHKLQEQTLAIVKTLSSKEAAEWQRYVENAQTVAQAKANASEAPKDDKLRKAREEAIGEWTSLLQSDNQLNAPIIIDFKGTLDSLANSVPATATNKSAQLFSNVQQQAQRLIDALKDVRNLRKKIRDEMKAAAGP
ncbi:MAG: hypothetical protein M3R59_11455, partial [Verrucomicrobiota bacterium]|nr:hypothetical protein [Verrucomicrobiota bacterium]